MVFAEAERRGMLAVLSQDELLEFERMLETAPEVYDYCANMTDEQLNHLIAFISRNKENMFLELRHVKEDRDAKARALEEKDRIIAEQETELTRKDRVIREKNKALAKRDKKISDLEERLEESREGRYGRRRGNAKKASAAEDETKDDGPDQSNDNPGGADRQQGEDEYDGRTPQDPVTEDNTGDGKGSSSTGRTFNPENRPEEYSTMGLLNLSGVEEMKTLLRNTDHKFDRSRLPEGAVIKDRRIDTSYMMKTVLIKETIEKLRVRLPGEKSARWMYIPMPGDESRRPVGGTKASPELLQTLSYETYVKRVSLRNLLRQLQDIGMRISKNTLRNWLKKGKRHLDRLIMDLKDKALEKDSIVNCDETWCKVRRFNKYMKKYMWVLVNKAERIVIFFYDEGSRVRKVLTDFMGEADVRAIMTDGYTAYNFLDGRLGVDHLICMAHAHVKFKKAHNLGKDASAIRFIELIERLYELERSYKAGGYTARQIYEARQSAETSDIERRLRALLTEELDKENPKRSYYMEQVLSYFDHFKDGLFLYRRDGRYPIDNNLAERQVRPFTALRKVIQHYGSDEGAETASVYLSVVSTVKLAGVSVWRFLGDFFEDAVTGGRKHLGHLRLSPA